MTYPPNWPSCGCGQPLLDGHLTCGEASCSESDARDRQARQAASRSLWICRSCDGRMLAAGEPESCSHCGSSRLRPVAR